MRESQILVAGIGNIFLGDDAFGCRAIEHLQGSGERLEGVDLIDFGIRGFDLAYALTTDYQLAILVDAYSNGCIPGTVTTIELSTDDFRESDQIPNAHGMHPVNVLRLVDSLGGTKCRMYLVGCEPATFGDELQGSMELSTEVEQALTIASQHVLALIDQHQANQSAPSGLNTSSHLT